MEKVDYDRKLTTYINELVSKQNISDENKASTFIIEKNNNVKVKKRTKNNSLFNFIML